MPTLWERLEAKDVQRAQVPILVGDLRAAQHEAVLAQSALAEHEKTVAAKARKPSAADRKTTAELTEKFQAAAAAIAGTVVLVDVQALPGPTYERLVSAHIAPDGDTNLESLLPALLAESCVEPDLRDEAKWAEQLARPVWTEGELLDLRQRLMVLNMHVVSVGLGKG